MNRKRLMISIPMLCTGGTEIQTRHLCQGLIEYGYDIQLCCLYEYEDHMVDQFRSIGVDVQLFSRERTTALGELMALVRVLRERIREWRPDIVHVQYVTPGLPPIIAARLSRVSLVTATVHQSGAQFGAKARWLLRTAAALCNHFYCTSESAEKSWFGSSAIVSTNNISDRRHATLYNGVDTERIQRTMLATDGDALRQKHQIPTTTVVIGIVARLHPVKGYPFLLNSLSELYHSGQTDFVLLAIGEGPERRTLEKLASELDLSPHIRWLGRLDQDTTFAYLRIVDIAAVPSVSEGFGLSAVEAMAAERPVVASAVGGLTEVVADGETGFLVNYGDTKSFSHRLNQLMTSAQQRQTMGKRGGVRARQRFGVKTFIDTHHAIYQHA